MLEKPCGLRVAVCRVYVHVVAFLFTVWYKDVMLEKPCGLRVAVCEVVAFLFTVWCKEVRRLVATSAVCRVVCPSYSLCGARE